MEWKDLWYLVPGASLVWYTKKSYHKDRAAGKRKKIMAATFANLTYMVGGMAVAFTWAGLADSTGEMNPVKQYQVYKEKDMDRKEYAAKWDTLKSYADKDSNGLDFEEVKDMYSRIDPEKKVDFGYNPLHSKMFMSFDKPTLIELEKAIESYEAERYERIE